MAWAVFFWAIKIGSLTIAALSWALLIDGIFITLFITKIVLGINYFLRWHALSAFIVCNIASSNYFYML